MHTSIQMLAHSSPSIPQFQKATKTFSLNSYKSLTPEIVFITTFPPRECGIATYSQDLIKALNLKFSNSFKISTCPIVEQTTQTLNGNDKSFELNINAPCAFELLAKQINNSPSLKLVLVQHEFGLFRTKENQFIQFLIALNKPAIVAFHTVLPSPSEELLLKVQKIAGASSSIIVMTQTSANILINEYNIAENKITVISHGTHLIEPKNKEALKIKYNVYSRFVLSTFGLLSSGKNLETTLKALPNIVRTHKDVLFLIIGKTHPTVVENDGEAYRESLEKLITELHIEPYVKFINHYLPLPELLEYLQLTDIYLFTSKDRHQAVSGTFAYAMSCGCPIISTPIPHATEVLGDNTGIIIDFENPIQLSKAILKLKNNDQLRADLSSNGLHKIAATAWENSAIAHAKLFQILNETNFNLKYNMPPIKLDHIKKMSTDFGMLQFSALNLPDNDSGYTLDDNARALVAMCQHYELNGNEDDLVYIKCYFNFIKFCLQKEGYFLNYVDITKQFTSQNQTSNLADANGRAIWALGYLIAMKNYLPESEKAMCSEAEQIIQNAVLHLNNIHSTRAMAFVIKGLYYSNTATQSVQNTTLITGLANRLVQMYKHEQDDEWQWFESYLTYANSILPEAMLCAYLATGDVKYREIAKSTFDFLLTKSFTNDGIRVVSNKGWLYRDQEKTIKEKGGEQPIDVAYTILALKKFYAVFNDASYKQKMETAMDWFMGNNHLNQVIYNPSTGGCYDGLEDEYVNLNQGAESAVSYLMARLTFEPTGDHLKFLPINHLEALNTRQLEQLSMVN